MITEIEDYFTKGCGRCDRFATPQCSALVWGEGIALLRQICREAGLEETVKWGQPCYTHASHNIAILGAFRANFTIGFFNPSLMTDPEGLLERRGPNTRTAGTMFFTDAAQVRARASVIAAYMKESKGYADQGLKPVKQVSELTLPYELLHALDRDSELAEAFHALTPGRKKSYVIALNSAKKPETRVARLEKYRPKILAGKGALER
ncbi:YdeI/OmpD-associated family protein [Rhodobacteraceae bacterium N5(2021)]|uniref:YdeI/OmpD-associated family protein n=2 Tax=Gymnodinialimonas phycosphaerae TaxID=2841589 RepID=A0A975TZI5_9RHOB|nr:YdeI/OmpD-associated family protein [Gymnodinialimonas phycosphaerae]